MKTLPASEVGINKRSGYYSENKRDHDNLPTFRQFIAAYDGLLAIGFIEVAKEGHYEKETGEGEITLIIAKDELLEGLLD